MEYTSQYYCGITVRVDAATGFIKLNELWSACGLGQCDVPKLLNQSSVFVQELLSAQQYVWFGEVGNEYVHPHLAFHLLCVSCPSFAIAAYTEIQKRECRAIGGKFALLAVYENSFVYRVLSETSAKKQMRELETKKWTIVSLRYEPPGFNSKALLKKAIQARNAARIAERIARGMKPKDARNHERDSYNGRTGALICAKSDLAAYIELLNRASFNHK